MTTPYSQTDTPHLCAEAVFAGASDAAERLRLRVARIAPHFRTALITGEPGTGKRTVAQHMHRLSPVAERMFVVIPAADFARHGQPTDGAGTTYIPGVESLDYALQSEFRQRLRGLDRESRVVVGSACDLRGLVATGRMRLDLYEPIAMLEIRLLPLRERRDDLPGIAQAMLPQAAFADGACVRMREHSWPGNLRELQSVCANLPASDTPFRAEHLVLALPQQAGSHEALRLEEVIQSHVRNVLERCAGNKLRAAEVLGISRSTLYRMLENRQALG